MIPMDDVIRQIEESIKFIRSKTSFVPEVAVILGSGLSDVVDEIKLDASIPYSQIPNFPISTVIGHSGNLLLGTWNSKKVIVMSGRFHYYEGYSLQQVTFPIRIMKMLGAKTIFITNASGGLNPAIKVGELMVIEDHINLNSDHPLRGKNNESLGPRFPDQHRVYDLELVEKAEKIARHQNIQLHRGVYVGVTGPTFETPAEYRFLRLIGGDAVGMSTVPEVIVANHMGMRIFCITVITDEGNPAVPQKVTHEEVVKAAREAEPKMKSLLSKLLLHT
jgi:purine-nucleoside phosphorylase